jgi:16S rRNA processing protein RimM
MIRRLQPNPPALRRIIGADPPTPDGSAVSTDPPRLEVGRVGRAHGIRGEVALTLVTDRVERVAPGAVLWAGGRRLEVRSSRPHQGRFLVHFEGVGDRSAAEVLHGAVLSAEPLDDPGALWVHELVGAEVIAAADGTSLGTVAAVEANPASDLLVLDGGGLVPLTFLVRVEAGRLVVDPPAGLLD